MKLLSNILGGLLLGLALGFILGGAHQQNKDSKQLEERVYSQFGEGDYGLMVNHYLQTGYKSPDLMDEEDEEEYNWNMTLHTDFNRNFIQESAGDSGINVLFVEQYEDNSIETLAVENITDSEYALLKQHSKPF